MKWREKRKRKLRTEVWHKRSVFSARWLLPTIHSAVTVETQRLASTRTGARSCSRAEEREVAVSGGGKIWEGRRDAVGRPDILGFYFLQRRGHVTSLGQTHLSKSHRVSQSWAIGELSLQHSAPHVGQPELWNFHHLSSSSSSSYTRSTTPPSPSNVRPGVWNMKRKITHAAERFVSPLLYLEEAVPWRNT